MDFAGGRGYGTVDKEGGLGAGDVFGEVGGPLLAVDCLDFGVGGEVIDGPVAEPGAYAVVAAKGVAAGEDETAGLGGVHLTMLSGGEGLGEIVVSHPFRKRRGKDGHGMVVAE